MKSKYSFDILKEKFERREQTFVRSLRGERRHELMFAQYNISPTEYRLLAFLYFTREDVEPSVIADSLHILRSTMTKLIDSLEKRGYVARKLHPTDRRRVYVALEPKGTKLAKQLIEQETAYSDAVEACFTPEEMQQYRDLFWRMQKARDNVLQDFLNTIGASSTTNLED